MAKTPEVFLNQLLTAKILAVDDVVLAINQSP